MACISFPLKAVSDIPVSLPRWWGTPWRSKSGIQSEGRAKPIKRGVWECETGPCCRGIDISWRHFFKKNKKKNKYKKVRQKANNIGLLDQKKGWFYLETHQCNGSAIAAYMENAALLESCRCLATEATKHFSDARAYSSVLTNSAGAQTVNILITTIYVDALCFETSVCVATERNELPYQNAASRSAQRNQTVPVSTNVPPPQPTPLLHTRWAKFYMSHYDFRITTFTSAMRTQTTHTSCASFFLFLQPTQLLQTYFKPINTQPLHQIDVNPLWPGGLFAFFFFFWKGTRLICSNLQR